MAHGRMRRVDEAVRAVLSDAIAKDLKDPRVGFVTVTGVKTSPDLRHARVYVSVLGDEQARAATLEGCARRTASCRARSHRELTLKHTPALTFEYDESVDRGHADLGAARRRPDPEDAAMPENGDRSSREQVLDELRGADKLIVVTHENPDGDALGSLLAMQEILERARQGQRDRSSTRASSRCRTSTGSCRSTGSLTAPPEDLEQRTIVFLDCGNLERNPAEAFRRPGHAHPQHRPPPRQHAASAPSTSSTRTHRARRRSSGT